METRKWQGPGEDGVTDDKDLMTVTIRQGLTCFSFPFVLGIWEEARW